MGESVKKGNVKGSTLALVALGSSLVTLAGAELLRPVETRSVPVPAIERPAVPESSVARDDAALIPPPEATDESTILARERMDDLERRLLALELRSSPERSPMDVQQGERSARRQLPDADLRDLVLEWVEQDRVDRGRAAQIDQEEQRRAEMEFEARHQAMMLAKEHGLEEWQEVEFAELFLEIGVRAQEIEASFDLETDDPAEFEARWLVFDEWVDQRERALTARLDPVMYQAIYGDEE